MDVERLARDLVRALRGTRTQAAFSRRLGYRTNVVQTWELGNRWPTVPVVLRAARIARRIDLREALRRFFMTQPTWLETVDPATSAGVAHLLTEIRGQTKLEPLARACGCSRYAVARWMSGAADPRLPDFLRLFEAASVRVLDFLALFVDVGELPSARAAWKRLISQRKAAYEMPWSAAVLLALELGQYAALERHVPGWIAATVGISPAEEDACLELLRRAGQVRWNGRRWTVSGKVAVDTRHDAAKNRELRRFWTQVALRQLERPDALASDLFSFNVFAVSRSDLQRLRKLHLDYFRSLRAIVAESSTSECVAVANVQLFTLTRS